MMTMQVSSSAELEHVEHEWTLTERLARGLHGATDWPPVCRCRNWLRISKPTRSGWLIEKGADVARLRGLGQTTGSRLLQIFRPIRGWDGAGSSLRKPP
jgi:hypothetical protein